VQAKDITDAEVLAAHAVVKSRWAANWSTTWDLQAALSPYPPKVVLAKLRSMNRRKVLLGCGCGCRGDWHLPGSS
jgi:hypothetical protein